MGDIGYSKSDQIQFITRTSFKSKMCDQLKDPYLGIKEQRKRTWIDASNNITTYHKNNLQHQYVVNTLHTNQIVLPKESNINLQADKEFIFRVGRGITNSGMINKKIIEEKEYEQQKDVYDAIHKEPENINKPEIQLKSISNVVQNVNQNLTTPDTNVSTNIQTNQPIGGREINNMNKEAVSPQYSDSGYSTLTYRSDITHELFIDKPIGEKIAIVRDYRKLLNGEYITSQYISIEEQNNFKKAMDIDNLNATNNPHYIRMTDKHIKDLQRLIEIDPNYNPNRTSRSTRPTFGNLGRPSRT